MGKSIFGIPVVETFALEPNEIRFEDLSRLSRPIDDKDLREIIARDFAKELTVRMGYDFDDERVGRIARQARRIMEDERVPAVWAFAGAIEEDLLLYGTAEPSVDPIGLMSAPS